MTITHKNKTLATFLAAVFGGFGAHRFYLYGMRDFWAWAHFLTAPLSGLMILSAPRQPVLFLATLFVASVLSAFIEALVIGLTPDDKWDAAHNAGSGRHSASGWPLALLLVLTVATGATATIATIARTFDLLYTGGGYDG